MTVKQQKLFNATLAQIPHTGWTDEALVLGARSAGISLAEARKVFPKGIPDIVAAYHQSLSDEMRARVKAKRKFSALRTRDQVTFAVRARLEAAAPSREAMRRLLLWSIMPRHVAQAAKYVWQAADEIWLACGDTSTDYNYYTKRLLLVGVMKSVLSFWLHDGSAQYKETWDFLDRRIADIMKLGKTLSVIKTVGLTDIVSFARSRFAA